MPSEFISSMNEIIKSKYLQFYRPADVITKDEDVVMKRSPSPTFAEMRDNWAKKKKDTLQREKGFYYTNFELGISSLNNIEQQLDFDKLFFNIEQESSCFTLVETIYNQLENESDFFKIAYLLDENKQLLLNTLNNLRGNLDQKLYLSVSYTIDASFQDILGLNGVSKDFTAVQVRGDGNCFYRALSFLIYGSERNFTVVKLCSLFTIVNSFPNIFKHLLQRLCHSDSFELFVTGCFKSNEWATEYNILSVALMLQTSIFCFGCRTPTTTTLLSHNIFYTWPNVFEENCKILIAFKGSHFVPIIFAGELFDKIRHLKFTNQFANFFD